MVAMQESAAIRIQCGFRGRGPRSQLRAHRRLKDHSLHVLQSWWRGCKGREEASGVRKGFALASAVSEVQRRWKGAVARRRYVGSGRGGGMPVGGVGNKSGTGVRVYGLRYVFPLFIFVRLTMSALN